MFENISDPAHTAYIVISTVSFVAALFFIRYLSKVDKGLEREIELLQRGKND